MCWVQSVVTVQASRPDVGFIAGLAAVGAGLVAAGEGGREAWTSLLLLAQVGIIVRVGLVAVGQVLRLYELVVFSFILGGSGDSPGPSLHLGCLALSLPLLLLFVPHRGAGALYRFNGTLYQFNGALYQFNGTLYRFNGTLYQFNGTLYRCTGTLTRFD